jgi:hypothetical protein
MCVRQDKEPPPEQMLVTHLYRPAFVEGFPEEYKEFVNDRGKGLHVFVCF